MQPVRMLSTVQLLNCLRIFEIRPNLFSRLRKKRCWWAFLTTDRTCHPLSIFGMLCIGVYDSVFQYLPISSNFALQRRANFAIEEEWTNIPQATINNLINSMRRRCVALHEGNDGQTPPPNVNFRVAFYCDQPKAHLCNNNAV